MIIYKTEAEIALMKQSAMLVSKTLTEVAAMLKPGVTTLGIDRLCGTFVRDHKAIPSFLNYRGYPPPQIAPNRKRWPRIAILDARRVRFLLFYVPDFPFLSTQQLNYSDFLTC